MHWISQSKADVVLLGLDLNAGPVSEDGNSNIHANKWYTNLLCMKLVK